MKSRMSTKQSSQRISALEVACLVRLPRDSSEYIKLERNFPKSRFLEILSKIDSRDSKIHTGWYLGSTQESET